LSSVFLYSDRFFNDDAIINFKLIIQAAKIKGILFTGCTQRYVTEVYETPGATTPTQKTYSVNGNVYYPKKTVSIGWSEEGIASWYGPNFHGKYTSNGEVYNMYKRTAAHKTWPMNTMVKVTNLDNGKSTVVRINDRGPFVKGRIIDCSYAAGKDLGLDKTGLPHVKLKVLALAGAADSKKTTTTKSKPKNNIRFNNFSIPIGIFSNYNRVKRYNKTVYQWYHS